MYAVAKYHRSRGNTVPPRTNIANLQPWCLISGYQLRYQVSDLTQNFDGQLPNTLYVPPSGAYLPEVHNANRVVQRRRRLQAIYCSFPFVQLCAIKSSPPPTHRTVSYHDHAASSTPLLAATGDAEDATCTCRQQKARIIIIIIIIITGRGRRRQQLR